MYDNGTEKEKDVETKTSKRVDGFFLWFNRGNFELIMDDELQKRFFQLKLQELLTDSTRPFPTYIFERERIKIIELVRKFCMYSPMMIPYKAGYSFSYVPEGLECQKVVDYGDLYALVNLN